MKCAHCNGHGTQWADEAFTDRLVICTACNGRGYLRMLRLDDPDSLDAADAKDAREERDGRYR